MQVFAKGAPTPAFEVGFSQVSFDAPDAANFQFSPPPGATVTESTLGGQDRCRRRADQPAVPKAARPAGAAEPTIVGTGWTSVLVAKVPSTAATPDAVAPGRSAPPTARQRPRRARLPRFRRRSRARSWVALPAVSGDWGSGRLLQSALFSVLITDDGRMIAGAVAPEQLYQAAAQ